MHKGLALIALLALMGCGAGTSPEAIVYQAHIGYYGALGAENTYADLPTCSDTQKQPCKDHDTAQKVLLADQTAFTALKSAQDVVRTPTLSDGLKKAAANNAADAVNVFRNILVQFGILGATNGQ